MFGPTEKPMKDNGHKIKCTVKESWFGPMASGMKAPLLMIRGKDAAFSGGMMEEFTTACGKTENSTDKEAFSQTTKSVTENGKMENTSNGCRNRDHSNQTQIGKFQ